MISEFVRNMTRRFSLIMSWGAVENTDTSKLKVKLGRGGVTLDVALASPFGLVSKPSRGKNFVAISNGLLDTMTVIGTEADLSQLKDGETLIYSDHNSSILLDSKGVLRIKAEKINLEIGNNNLVESFLQMADAIDKHLATLKTIDGKAVISEPNLSLAKIISNIRAKCT